MRKKCIIRLEKSSAKYKMRQFDHTNCLKQGNLQHNMHKDKVSWCFKTTLGLVSQEPKKHPVSPAETPYTCVKSVRQEHCTSAPTRRRP